MAMKKASDNEMVVSPEEEKATIADLNLVFDEKARTYVLHRLTNNFVKYCFFHHQELLSLCILITTLMHVSVSGTMFQSHLTLKYRVISI